MVSGSRSGCPIFLTGKQVEMDGILVKFPIDFRSGYEYNASYCHAFFGRFRTGYRGIRLKKKLAYGMMPFGF